MTFMASNADEAHEHALATGHRIRLVVSNKAVVATCKDCSALG